MKARALAKCEITDADKPKRHWRDDPGLMTFLRALQRWSYVAFRFADFLIPLGSPLGAT